MLTHSGATTLSENEYTKGGRVRLYKRDRSPFWQATFRQPSGRYKRFSTKTADLDEARSIAETEYVRMEIRIADGSFVDRSFKQVAEEAIKDIDSWEGTEKYKVIYADYKWIIRKYLIPFFGKMDISKIGEAEISQFDDYRYSIVNRRLSVSTIQSHNSALSFVFKRAIAKGYIKERPRISRQGTTSKKQKPRAFFTIEEAKKLVRFALEWCQTGYKKENINQRTINKKSTREVRQVLFALIGIVLYTGIRPGYETKNLKWSDITQEKLDDVDYYVFWVKGKGKEARPVIPIKGITAYLYTLRKLHSDLAQLKWHDLLKVERPIFLLPNGKPPSNLSKQFRQLLLDADMLYDGAGEPRTLYSLRHTNLLMLLKEKELSLIDAANYLGTSIQMVTQFYYHNQTLINPEKLVDMTLHDHMKKILPRIRDVDNHMREKYGDDLLETIKPPKDEHTEDKFINTLSERNSRQDD